MRLSAKLFLVATLLFACSLADASQVTTKSGSAGNVPAGAVYRLSPTAVVASSTHTQAAATVLSPGFNFVTGSINDTIKMPASCTAGDLVIIFSNSASGETFVLYPATGETLYPLAANASHSVPYYSTETWVCSTSGNWQMQFPLAVRCTTFSGCTWSWSNTTQTMFTIAGGNSPSVSVGTAIPLILNGALEESQNLAVTATASGSCPGGTLTKTINTVTTSGAGGTDCVRLGDPQTFTHQRVSNRSSHAIVLDSPTGGTICTPVVGGVVVTTGSADTCALSTLTLADGSSVDCSTTTATEMICE